MPRPVLVQSDDLFARLSFAFRDVGFEAPSMAILSERTGLKRASLYHRFPGGKEQMAEEVLTNANSGMEENVISPLRSGQPPTERLASVIAALEAFYEGGARACLLNMLATPTEASSSFATAIRKTFEDWISAFASCARSAGFSEPLAQARAVRAVTMIQGALVVSRGLGRTDPFRDALEGLPSVLLDCKE